MWSNSLRHPVYYLSPLGTNKADQHIKDSDPVKLYLTSCFHNSLTTSLTTVLQHTSSSKHWSKDKFRHGPQPTWECVVGEEAAAVIWGT